MISAIIIIIGIIVLTALILLLTVLLIRKTDDSLRPRKHQIELTPPWELAGRAGERAVREMIRPLLTENDILLNNVTIETDGRQTELDNVIINNRGVFIIETKNYTGSLSGTENDYYWRKTKTSLGGDVHEKLVVNPVRQVKRQVYLLAQYLKTYNCDVWVCGYVFILNAACPVESDIILISKQDIDRVIHHAHNNRLTKKQKDLIVKILSL